MWTICWINSNGQDVWDRFDTHNDLLQYMIEQGIDEYDEDVLIFSPDANNYIVSAYDIYQG